MNFKITPINEPAMTERVASLGWRIKRLTAEKSRLCAKADIKEESVDRWIIPGTTNIYYLEKEQQ